MYKFIPYIFCFLSLSIIAQAQVINELSSDPIIYLTEELEPQQNHSEAKQGISYFDAVILGIVEGTTEYLPISSTGHLILTNELLGLNTTTPIKDASGEVVFNEKFSPLTMKSIADAYAIIIQLGAILAVAILYWESLFKMAMGLCGKNPLGLRLFINLIVAFLPAAIVGFCLHSFIEENLFGVMPIIVSLFVGAIVMIYVQYRFNKRATIITQFRRLDNLTLRGAFTIGILQCIAMWPGTSRSMMTIIGGYVAGLAPADSAKFSFLLGLITLSAASIFKIYTDGEAILRAVSSGPMLIGMAVAFVSAAISVKWFVGFLTRSGLIPFAYYRIFLALILFSLYYFGAI